MTIFEANKYLKLNDEELAELCALSQKVEESEALSGYLKDAYREIYIEKRDHAEVEKKYNELVDDDAFDGFFYILVGILNMERLIEIYNEHGISLDIMSDTLQDTAIFIRDRKSKTRRLNVPSRYWLSVGFSGRLFRLGRMQFEMTTIKEDSKIPGISKGDAVLEGHVPQGGPMDHDACWESYRRAFPFFEKHFNFSAKAVHLSTWMLDPTLVSLLPAESNIAKWANDVTLFPDILPGTLGRFIFGDNDFDPKTAPRDTSLRRSILDHIEAGGKFVNRAGVIMRETIMGK